MILKGSALRDFYYALNLNDGDVYFEVFGDTLYIDNYNSISLDRQEKNFSGFILSNYVFDIIYLLSLYKDLKLVLNRKKLFIIFNKDIIYSCPIF